MTQNFESPNSPDRSDDDFERKFLDIVERKESSQPLQMDVMYDGNGQPFVITTQQLDRYTETNAELLAPKDNEHRIIIEPNSGCNGFSCSYLLPSILVEGEKPEYLDAYMIDSSELHQPPIAKKWGDPRRVSRRASDGMIALREGVVVATVKALSQYNDNEMSALADLNQSTNPVLTDAVIMTMNMVSDSTGTGNFSRAKRV